MPAPAPLGPRYSALRFQVDPLWPPPRRDVRYVMIVTGAAFLLVGILLLAVSAVVSSAVSAGCAPPGCSVVNPGTWFAWIGLPFLALGIVLLLVGIWWALR